MKNNTNFNTSLHLSALSPLNPYYITGISDAESCFAIILPPPAFLPLACSLAAERLRAKGGGREKIKNTKQGDEWKLVTKYIWTKRIENY